MRIASPHLRKEAEMKVSHEAEEEHKIKVADSLRGSHRLVRAANAVLQRADTDDVGLIDPGGTGLDAQVSKKSLHRSLLIMDAILKALESRGYEVSQGPVATILGVEILFGISEQISTIKEEPESPDLEGHYVFSHSRFTQKQVPSGKLTLQIHEGGGYNDWSRGCRKTWRDGKKQRIEERLNGFVVGLVEVAAQKKEHEEAQARKTEERRKQQELEAAKERRRAKIHETAKRERARVEDLFMRSEAWSISERLRAFIEAETQKHIRKHGQIEPGTEFAEWREWAIRQADRQDPLLNSPPSILDEDDGREDKPSRGWKW